MEKILRSTNHALSYDNSLSNQIDVDEDAQIDLSEIPEWTDGMFVKARHGHYNLPQEKLDVSKLDN